MKPVIYSVITVLVVLVISYISYIYYTTRASETYIDAPFNLIVVDGNGNMSSAAVRPPSLVGIPQASNIVYIDSSGNIGVMSVGDVYTSYQGNSSNSIRNLLTIDANNNFGVLSTLNFNPCHVNGDPATNPNATMNGAPQRDGTCSCRNNWSGTTKGDGCAVCDGYGVTHADGSFGTLAGPDCQYSRAANCSGHGNVNGSGGCSCDSTYAGSVCQYSDGANCNGRGYVDANGNCPTCYTYVSNADGLTRRYLGNRCQFGDNTTCGGNGSFAQTDGSCKWLIRQYDFIRISSNGTYLRSIDGAWYCGRGWNENAGWAQGFAFTGGYDESRCRFLWKNGIFYYNDKAVLPQYKVNDSNSVASIAGSIYGNAVLTTNPIGRPPSLFIQQYGLSGSKDNWKLSLNNPTTYISGTRYLGNEYVEERFYDGWAHASAWANAGGGHGPGHWMAGFGTTTGAGLPLKIEKMGTDGQWYSIDGIL